jgi:hypothetical protein
MVDLDLKDFSDEKKRRKPVLDRVLNKTLQNIKETTGGNPTVLWTGNGYHETNLSADFCWKSMKHSMSLQNILIKI